MAFIATHNWPWSIAIDKAINTHEAIMIEYQYKHTEK